MDFSERKVKIALLGIMVFLTLTVVSVHHTSGYTEHEVWVEGEPVSDVDSDAVLLQEEMTANQYQIAQSLMSTTEIVNQDKTMNGDPAGYTSGQIGSFDSVTYKSSEIEPFLTNSYVEIDGEYYEIQTEVIEDVNRYSSMSLFGFLTIIAFFICGISLIGFWIEDRE